jgi:hypothetical protein
VTEDDLLAFVAGTLGSIWALELLTLLKRDPARGWDPATLVQELRSSSIVIDEALERLHGAGLVAKDSSGLHRYRAASPHLDAMVRELEKVYAEKPMTVIRAIGTSR